jgi:carbon monoxide dehydrogenase subunit G
LKVTLDLALEPAGDGTRLVVTADANILGKLGTLGHGIIQHKADGIMTQFAEALRKELEGRGETSAPAV